MCATSVGPAAAGTKAHGFFSEAGLGGVGLLKPKSTLAIGPTVTLRIGYDLFSWFSIGAVASLATQRSTLPAPPDNEYHQLYRGGAIARIGGQVGPVALYLNGGLGVARVSTNLLERVGVIDPGQRNSVAFLAGAGVEYQLENRHYALGLGGDGWLFTQFNASTAIDARLYLRYTY
ncbi:MAG: hypothetical protein KBG15_07590 [Kofleriaceae bacterium]|nr:hypothetical protein [Kofleriaceae bacterium]